MAKKHVHIVPRGEGWAVKREGARRASVTTGTQREAIDAGRTIAKREATEMLIHGRDGQIREKNSYGNDPNPPKDKK